MDDEGGPRGGGGKSRPRIHRNFLGWRSGCGCHFLRYSRYQVDVRMVYGLREENTAANDASGWWSGSLELLDSGISSLDSEVGSLLAQKR